MEVVTERNAEIRRLRFEEGLHTRDIGKRLGISRQRVCQILGRTGFAAKEFRLKAARSMTNKNNDEVAEILGVSVATVVAYRGDVRHSVKGGKLQSGIEIENRVSEILKEHGIENTLMPIHHPFDILLSNGLRIDVKAAYKTMQPRSQKYPFYNFQTGKSRKEKFCDFFILVVVPTMAAYVIPYGDAGSGNIRIQVTGKSRKWISYINRFDLLK